MAPQVKKSRGRKARRERKQTQRRRLKMMTNIQMLQQTLRRLPRLPPPPPPSLTLVAGVKSVSPTSVGCWPTWSAAPCPRSVSSSAHSAPRSWSTSAPCSGTGPRLTATRRASRRRWPVTSAGGPSPTRQVRMSCSGGSKACRMLQQCHVCAPSRPHSRYDLPQTHRALWREAVRLRGMRRKVRRQLVSEEPHAAAHGGETVPLQALRHELQRGCCTRLPHQEETLGGYDTHTQMSQSVREISCLWSLCVQSVLILFVFFVFREDVCVSVLQGRLRPVYWADASCANTHWRPALRVSGMWQRLQPGQWTHCPPAHLPQ